MTEYARGLIKYALGIWFAAWAFRRKYKLDYPLDRGIQMLRWAVILVTFALALIHGPNAKWIRLCGGLTALAFLCWPNFAYHLARLFGRRASQRLGLEKDSVDPRQLTPP
jgi:hypothetical protein